MEAVLIGVGGHGRVVLDAARAHGMNIVAIVDANISLRGTSFDGLPIVGGEDELETLRQQGVDAALIGVGCVEATRARERLYDRIAAKGFTFPVVRHPSATVAANAVLGAGCVVFAGAIVNPGASVGRNVILNTASLVEHDCAIGDHVHISPGARLAGGVRIGARSHVGIGAIVIQGIEIGADVTIGAGAVVIRDVPAGQRVAGIPARALPPKDA